MTDAAPEAEEVIALVNQRWPGSAWTSRYTNGDPNRVTIDIARKDAREALDLLVGLGVSVTITDWEQAEIHLPNAHGRLTAQANCTDGARLISRALIDLEDRIGQSVLALMADGTGLPEDVLNTIDWDAIAATDDERTSTWGIVAIAESLGQQLEFAADVDLDPVGETLATLLIDLRREEITDSDRMYNFYDQTLLIDLAVDNGVDLVAAARQLNRDTRKLTAAPRTGWTLGR